MELKIVISDPETGKAYQQELKDDRAIRFKGKKLGDEISGSVLGLEGYTLKITGGSDRSGFPIKPGVHGTARPKILMTEGIGYHPTRKVRSKKRVRGENIDEDITQVNTKVVKKGRMDIAELIGAAGEEGEAAEAGAEKPPEAKPTEEEKSAEAPKVEEPKPEEPVEEKPAEEPAEEKPAGGATPEEPKQEEKKEEPKPEEKPAEEEKPEEKPVEEPKAEEPKAEEKPAEEVKPEEPKPEEKPAEVEEKPAEEAEKPAEENKA